MTLEQNDRTDWFPLEIKPVRVGVYERDIPGIGIRFSGWTGQFWCGFATQYDHARQNWRSGFPSAHQDGGYWRGLARKP